MKAHLILLFILSVLFPPLLQALSLNESQKSDGDCSPNLKDLQVEGGLTIICLSLESFVAALNQREQQVKNQLNALHQKEVTLYQEKLGLSAKDKALVNKELRLIQREQALLNNSLLIAQQQLADKERNYQKRITFLERTIKELRAFSGEVNDQLLAEASFALRRGDTEKADTLFKQVEEKEKGSIERAAKAAFERGKIAEANIDYQKAYQHFERAVGLAPNNTEHLTWAGSMAGTVANHKKEIEWQEKALAIALKKNGEDSPEVATGRNNLGSAWFSLGEYQKAIDSFKQALASDLKTYGEG